MANRGNYFKQFVLGQAMALNQAGAKALEEILNSDIQKIQDSVKVANNSVTYSVVNNIAIIGVDGGMYKKDMSAMCVNVASYEKMVSFIDEAEKDSQVSKILFRVDTPGGFVSGADEVRHRILNSTKHTITFFENMGASGGMWVFTASKELYAAPVTQLGSIGVKIAYEEEDESKIVRVVSKNAINKDCNLNGDCQQKIQNMVDETEDDFFIALKENTGFEKEALIELFNNGDTIKAEVAQKAGFIKEVIHFNPLMKKLTSEVATAAVPTVHKNDKPANKIQGENMTDKDIMASEPYTQLVASHEEQVKAMESKLGEANASLAEMKAKVEAQEAWAKELPEVCAMAISRSVSQDTLVAMVTAGDTTKAKAFMVDGMKSEGAFGAQETDKESEKEDKAKVFEEKAKALGVTFIGGNK